MRRLLACSLLLLGGALAVPAGLDLAGRPAQALAAVRRPLDDARACKPQPPLQASLELLAQEGDEVELLLAVAPREGAAGLRWSLDLPPGAVRLAGPVGGQLDAGQGSGPQRVRLRLSGAAGERVALRVEGRREGEGLVARRALTWGHPRREPPASAVPGRAAHVPVRHRGSAP